MSRVTRDTTVLGATVERAGSSFSARDPTKPQPTDDDMARPLSIMKAPSTALGWALSLSFDTRLPATPDSIGTAVEGGTDDCSIWWRTSSRTMRDVRNTLGLRSVTAREIMAQRAGAATSKPKARLR